MKMGGHHAICITTRDVDHAEVIQSRILCASQREVVEIRSQPESPEEEHNNELFSSLFEPKGMPEPTFIQSDAEICKIIAALDRIPDFQHGVVSHLGQNLGDIRIGSYVEHEPIFDLEFDEAEIINLLEAFPNFPPEISVESAHKKNAAVVKTANKRIIPSSHGTSIEESPTKKRKEVRKTDIKTPLKFVLELSGGFTTKTVQADSAVVDELSQNQIAVTGKQSLDATQAGGDNSKIKLSVLFSSFPAPQQSQGMPTLGNILFSARAANGVKIAFPTINSTTTLADTQNLKKDAVAKMDKTTPKPRGKPLKSTFKKAQIQRTEPKQQPPFPQAPFQPPLPNEPIPRANWYSEVGHNQYQATTPHSPQQLSADGKSFAAVNTGYNHWASRQQPQGGLNNSFPPYLQNGDMQLQPTLQDGPSPACPLPNHDFAVRYPSQYGDIQYHQKNQSGGQNPFYNNNRGGRGSRGGRGGKVVRGNRGEMGDRHGTQSFEAAPATTSETYFKHNLNQGDGLYNNHALPIYPSHQNLHRDQVIPLLGGSQQQKGSSAHNNTSPSTPIPFNFNPATCPHTLCREVATISFTTTALRNQAVRNLINTIKHKPSFVGVSIIEPHLDTTTFKVEGLPHDNLRGKLRALFPKGNIHVSMT